MIVFLLSLLVDRAGVLKQIRTYPFWVMYPNRDKEYKHESILGPTKNIYPEAVDNNSLTLRRTTGVSRKCSFL
jgi:hypothetical protein